MRILYVATTFPVYSETFLQREARAFRELGVELTILSLHRGEPEFDGFEIDRFSKWELLTLFWRLPWIIVMRFSYFRAWFAELFTHRPPTSLSFWENMLGMGAAVARESQLRVLKPDLIHCVWSSAPASFGWVSSLLAGLPFSIGAHAYDVFDHGGDWLLKTKTRQATLVHTSTESAYSKLREFVAESKLRLIRRGMNRFPEFKPLRPDRDSLRLICVARLVEKKGFPYQIRIYEALRDAGIKFEARIVGEGELREEIESELRRKGRENQVVLRGRLTQAETMEELAWADVLIHTGVIARNGDRDGLPNVIPEAMASGALVLASPVSGVVEAIENEITGILANVEETESWVEQCRRIQKEDQLCERLRSAGRAWVEREWVASRNSGELLKAMRDRLSSEATTKILEAK